MNELPMEFIKDLTLMTIQKEAKKEGRDSKKEAGKKAKDSKKDKKDS